MKRVLLSFRVPLVVASALLLASVSHSQQQQKCVYGCASIKAATTPRFSGPQKDKPATRWVFDRRHTHYVLEQVHSLHAVKVKSRVLENEPKIRLAHRDFMWETPLCPGPYPTADASFWECSVPPYNPNRFFYVSVRECDMESPVDPKNN